MTSTECVHELAAEWCGLCKPPKRVLPHGYRARGATIYHNDPSCPWLRTGLRYAVAKCPELREVVAVSWNRANSADLVPCEHCCTPEFTARCGS